MDFWSGEIETLCPARMISRGSATVFSSMAIDSRDCSFGTLFVALKGERTDGHLFCEDAWNRGAAGVLLEKRGVFLPDFSVFQVDRSEKALKKLAQSSLQRLEGTRIAFTGTVGKTTAKNFFRSLLAPFFRVEATPRSFNTVVSLSVSLGNFSEKSDFYLVEAGINQLGEMEELAALAKPVIAMFSPFGEGHLEGLKDVELVAREKIQLVVQETRRVYQYAGNLRWPVVQELESREGLETVVYGGLRDSTAAVQLEEFSFDPDSARSRAGFRIGRERCFFQSSIVSPEVALLLGPAIHCALECGIKLSHLTESIESMSLPPGRESLYRFDQGVIIDDTYNANPLSMKKSLQLLDEFHRKGYEVWVVLGDMLELGNLSDQAHQELIRSLVKKKVDRSLLLGDRLRRAADRVFSEERGSGDVFLIADHQEGLNILRESLSLARHKWVVLFKGSRSMEMERAIPTEWRCI